jgi:hypothetical protein
MSLFGLGPGTVLEQLNNGLATRTAIDTRFQLDLFNRILQLLRELQDCPAAVQALPSGTAGALTITQAELTEFIRRLEHPDNMDADAIENIVDPIYRIGNNGDRSLRRTRGLPVRGDANRVVPPAAPRTGASGSTGLSSAPGSYRPPASGASAASGASGASGLSRYLPPFPSLFSSRPADPFASVVGSTNPLGNSGQLPNATVRNSISGSELDDFHSRMGGSRRRTRRAKKYRNRT